MAICLVTGSKVGARYSLSTLPRYGLNAQLECNRRLHAESSSIAEQSARKSTLLAVQVAEQELRSLGVMHCSDLIMQRGLLTALHSEIAIDSFLEAGLGLGRTRHPEALKEGQVGRKGISVERTFSPISHQQDLEAKVCVQCPAYLPANPNSPLQAP